MRGYIALTTVIILIPLLLLTGIDSLYNNISFLVVGKMNYDYQSLETNSQSCLEEVIYRIKRARTFTGVIKLEEDEWECNTTVTDKEGEDGVKIIDMLATDNNGITIHHRKELNINTDPFELRNI